MARTPWRFGGGQTEFPGGAFRVGMPPGSIGNETPAPATAQNAAPTPGGAATTPQTNAGPMGTAGGLPGSFMGTTGATGATGEGPGGESAINTSGVTGFSGPLASMGVQALGMTPGLPSPIGLGLGLASQGLGRGGESMTNAQGQPVSSENTGNLYSSLLGSMGVGRAPGLNTTITNPNSQDPTVAQMTVPMSLTSPNVGTFGGLGGSPTADGMIPSTFSAMPGQTNAPGIFSLDVDAGKGPDPTPGVPTGQASPPADLGDIGIGQPGGPGGAGVGGGVGSGGAGTGGGAGPGGPPGLKKGGPVGGMRAGYALGGIVNPGASHLPSGTPGATNIGGFGSELGVGQATQTPQVLQELFNAGNAGSPAAQAFGGAEGINTQSFMANLAAAAQAQQMADIQAIADVNTSVGGGAGGGPGGDGGAGAAGGASSGIGDSGAGTAAGSGSGTGSLKKGGPVRPDPKKLSERLKGGGKVNTGKPGSKKDDVPVKLQRGEFVEPRAAAQQFGPQLEQMRQQALASQNGGMRVGPRR